MRSIYFLEPDPSSNILQVYIHSKPHRSESKCACGMHDLFIGFVFMLYAV